MKYEPLDTMEKVSYEGQFERLSYESVRGCAFGCKFCTWDAGIKCFRYKSAERIIKDCEEYMGENGIKRIEINDSTFLFPFSRIPELLEGFKRLGLHWKAHSRSDVPFDKEMVKALDESHCDILQIGFESMTDRILKNIIFLYLRWRTKAWTCGKSVTGTGSNCLRTKKIVCMGEAIGSTTG